MKINNTEIVDTYAEAFGMWSAKVIITAENDQKIAIKDLDLKNKENADLLENVRKLKEQRER